MAQSTQPAKKPAAKKTTTTTKNSNTKKQNASSKDRANQPDPKRSEIILFICLAANAFLLISAFGLGGVIGKYFAMFFFGLFGTITYLLPVYLFLTEAFLLSNGADKRIVKRVVCVGIFLVAIAFIIQLVAGAEGVTAKSLYMDGATEKKGSGFILGGLLALIFKFMGMAGSVIIIILLFIIGFILVLDRSFIGTMKKVVRVPDFSELKNARYDDEEDYDDPYDTPEEREERRERNKKQSFKHLSVLSGKEKKTKNREVPSEEIHELNPVRNNDVFGGDFFNSPEFTASFNVAEPQNEDDGNDSYTDSAFDLSVSDAESVKPAVTELKPSKRKTPEVSEEPPREVKTVADAIDARYAVIDEDEGKKNPYSQSIFKEDGSRNDSISGVRFSGNTPAKKDAAATPSKPSVSPTVKPAVSAPAKQTASGTEKSSAAAASNKADSEAEVIIPTSAPAPKKYIFPTLDLLKRAKKNGNGGVDSEVKDTAIKLKTTLENFGVKVTVTGYSQGPAVTRYEIQPEQGVKVSKITGLTDDIKLALAASDIRIEAPIPGKSAIGIEVPNKSSQSVGFRELLESDAYKNSKSNISFAVGKDISGAVVVADIAKMPHLLIAGATGSGKSVCINTLVMSILYKADPADVKLIMIDPKQVELAVYNGIPHMLIPVVTDPKKAAGALNWGVIEMTNRYKLFSEYNVRNLAGYNAKVKEVTGSEQGNEELKKLPQIVIIVDELADLMMVAHGEVEDAIVRLSQLARAAGIHLVIATQRPSVDVITGLIKANVPSRIAMSVSSGVDSRTILDMVGAEKLLGKGDMLFYPTGYPKPVRVQGAFLSDDEISDVCDFIKKKNGDTTYDESITNEIETSSSASSASASADAAPDNDSKYDEYFEDAARLIIGKDKASIGMLQRVYKIGFNRAARIMDQLSDAGVVGPEEGTKPRKVLMTEEQFDEYLDGGTPVEE